MMLTEEMRQLIDKMEQIRIPRRDMIFEGISRRGLLAGSVAAMLAPKANIAADAIDRLVTTVPKTSLDLFNDLLSASNQDKQAWTHLWRKIPNVDGVADLLMDDERKELFHKYGEYWNEYRYNLTNNNLNDLQAIRKMLGRTPRYEQFLAVLNRHGIDVMQGDWEKLLNWYWSDEIRATSEAMNDSRKLADKGISSQDIIKAANAMRQVMISSTDAAEIGSVPSALARSISTAARLLSRLLGQSTATVKNLGVTLAPSSDQTKQIPQIASPQPNVYSDLARDLNKSKSLVDRGN